MAAAQINLTIDKGSTFRKDFIWKAGLAITPVDLTGCTAKMQIRPAHGSPVLLLELTSNPAQYLSLGTTNGTISIDIPANVTREIAVENAVYDLEITMSDSSVTRLLYGSIEFTPEVTL